MGETVLVAGVGPNLGKTVARRLVAAGHQVGLVARSGDRVESLADALGDDAVPAAADITDTDDLGAAVAELRAAFGSADAVVHNANAPGGNPPAEATPERLAAVWRVRTLGLLHCLRAAPEAAAVVVSGTDYASSAAPEQVEWGQRRGRDEGAGPVGRRGRRGRRHLRRNWRGRRAAGEHVPQRRRRRPSRRPLPRVARPRPRLPRRAGGPGVTRHRPRRTRA
ncbi:hypothetical protein BRC84_07175 [Halobacteriales archaeon QS_1_68_44]|nr:MAG: hypothetical protein BRC84_07175 [Halobacteriales archaeon QS_1_68_44]